MTCAPTPDVAAESVSLVGVVLDGSVQLTRLIGQGGMGAVYEGVQLRLNKRVAVKLLAHELSANREALLRFRREAEVTSQLGHPNIVQVFDFGSAPTGEPYLVMEYLEGEDLERRLARERRLPFVSVARIVSQVASALSSTHGKGIIHRDLKPANVFLMRLDDGTEFVKIVDFGISKVRAAGIRITGAATVVGTPSYMSPEQAGGTVEEIDHRTDQWSLACIAYEALAGRQPFIADTVQAVLYQVIHMQPPTLTAIAPDVPDQVARVVHRALSKARGDRYPTIMAFAHDLADATSAVAGPAAAATGDVPIASIADAYASTVLAPAARAGTALSPAAWGELQPAARVRPRRMSTWAAVATVVAAAIAGAAIVGVRVRPVRRHVALVAASPSPAAVAPRSAIVPVAPAIDVPEVSRAARVDARPLASDDDRTHSSHGVDRKPGERRHTASAGSIGGRSPGHGSTPRRRLIEEL